MKRMVWALFFFAFLTGWATAKESTTISQRLIRGGFENVRVSPAGDDELAVAYENRLYRNEIKAAGIVLKLVEEGGGGFARVRLYPCNRGVALGQMVVDMAAYRSFLAGRIDAATFGKTLVVKPAAEMPAVPFTNWQNRSFLKTDITFTVGHQIQLGQYDDRVKIYGQFQPGLVSQLWPGNRVAAEAAIPFRDEIGIYHEETRLARLTLSQLFRLPRDVYAVIQTGIFVPERWGLSVETAAFWAQRRFLSGVRWDRTGFLYHDEDKWFYSSMGRNTCKLYTNWFVPWFDMMVGVDYSQYLLGDKGWRFTVRRTFADTDIDVYFAMTDWDHFGGIQLRLPLPPSRRMRPARVRLTWPNQYTLGYRATSEASRLGGPLQTGLSVDTGWNLTDQLGNFTPRHIVFNFESWKDH